VNAPAGAFTATTPGGNLERPLDLGRDAAADVLRQFCGQYDW